MLTNKQERFVQELVKGKSQREAYKTAYDASRMKDSTIDSKACNLLKQDKVKARYDELMKPAEDETERMRKFIMEQLSKIASGEICDISTEYDAEGNVIRSKRTVKASDQANAINKLAEYYGVSAEQKEEITIRIEGAEEYLR